MYIYLPIDGLLIYVCVYICIYIVFSAYSLTKSKSNTVKPPLHNIVRQ